MAISCLITGCAKGDAAYTSKAMSFPNTEFAVISDAHYYDPTLWTSASIYQNCISTERKHMADSAEIVNFVIDEVASSGVKFVLVTGGLSFAGHFKSRLGKVRRALRY